MANTCLGSDNTAPNDVLEIVRRRVQGRRQWVDDHLCCIVEDLGGKACEGTTCAYAPDGQKTPDAYKPHRDVNTPIPAAKGRRGARAPRRQGRARGGRLGRARR